MRLIAHVYLSRLNQTVKNNIGSLFLHRFHLAKRLTFLIRSLAKLNILPKKAKILLYISRQKLLHKALFTHFNRPLLVQIGLNKNVSLRIYMLHLCQKTVITNRRYTINFLRLYIWKAQRLQDSLRM